MKTSVVVLELPNLYFIIHDGQENVSKQLTTHPIYQLIYVQMITLVFVFYIDHVRSYDGRSFSDPYYGY